MTTSTPLVDSVAIRDEREFLASDGAKLNVFRWLPDHDPFAVVHIVHGLAEHAGRYNEVAQHLCAKGFAVFADDHRGHGKTGNDYGVLGHIKVIKRS